MKNSTLSSVKSRRYYFQPISEKLHRQPNDPLLSTLVNTVISTWVRSMNDNELHAEIMADTFFGGSGKHRYLGAPLVQRSPRELHIEFRPCG